MARQPQMNQRPQMPDMTGASMPRQQGQAPDQNTVNQARQNIMQPSAELAAVLVSRLGAMSDEQLAELDRAITPEAAKALLMLLPELRALMQAISQSGQGGNAPQRQAGPQMGALGGMG
jgi:hypothetical protein